MHHFLGRVSPFSNVKVNRGFFAPLLVSFKVEFDRERMTVIEQRLPTILIAVLFGFQCFIVLVFNPNIIIGCNDYIDQYLITGNSVM